MPTKRTQREIRRAFGPEAMQVIAELAVRVERIERVLGLPAMNVSPRKLVKASVQPEPAA
jgi:hypothetical protein